MSLSSRLKFVIYTLVAVAAGSVIQYEQKAKILGPRREAHSSSDLATGFISSPKMRKRGLPIVGPVFLALNFDLLWDTFDTSEANSSSPITPTEAKRQKLDIALLEAAEKTIEDDIAIENPDNKQTELNKILKQICELRNLEQKEEYTKGISYEDEGIPALKEEIWNFFERNPAMKDRTRQFFYQALNNSSGQFFDEDVGLQDQLQSVLTVTQQNN